MIYSSMAAENPENDTKLVSIMLRVEGLVMLIGSIVLAIFFKYPWYLYLGLFFVADIPMLAYKKGNKIGATLYNYSHTTSIPFILLIIGVIFNLSGLISVMIILLGHIGYDRMNGFGLKYPTDINDTHLHRLSGLKNSIPSENE